VTELHSAGNDASILLTPDGKVALFASDRPGSSGLDIQEDPPGVVLRAPT